MSINAQIKGADTQYMVVTLAPGQTIVAEAGAMMSMDAGVTMETKSGTGDESAGFGGFLKRMVTGESLFVTHFTNTTDTEKTVRFAGPFPGHILRFDTSDGAAILCQRGAFMASGKDSEISVVFNEKFGTGLFGGEGFVLQRIEGGEAAFIHAGGSIEEVELNGESLYVDTGCLVAMTEGLDYEIEAVKGIKSALFGGEGLFLAKVTGTGKVWIQSQPFSKLVNEMDDKLPRNRGNN